MSRPDVILLDLDGTITDSIPGILRCLRLALPVLGMEATSDEELQTWLGPPLRHTLLERYGRTEEELDAFVAEYRAHYFGGGEYEFEVFPGMADLIADIAATDTRLVSPRPSRSSLPSACSPAPGLIEHFDFVSGTELDLMRQDKPSVIAHGVEGVGLDPAAVDAVMVGDRKEDILGGQHFGYRTVGVRWGYADPGELEAADATIWWILRTSFAPSSGCDSDRSGSGMTRRTVADATGVRPHR